MGGLKLARLPDRTPVKLAIRLSPELHRALADYSRVYAAVYGRKESVNDLVPAILASFLDSDRAFQTARRERVEPGQAMAPDPSSRR